VAKRTKKKLSSKKANKVGAAPKSAKAGQPRNGKTRTTKVSKSPERVLAEKSALAMWGLLSKGGEAYGGKLKPRIDEAERAWLEQAGLISVSKVKRAYLLTVTDYGWDWAEQHLSDPLPDNVAGASVLHDWLVRLQALLLSQNIRLYELFADKQESSQAKATDLKITNFEEIRERIRAAYLNVAGGLDRRILLRDLRPKLADIDRDLVDAALMRMLRDDEVSLMRLDYRPEVTEEDHDAALMIGSEPRHIIWILK
jgi:hypothetical protein